MNINQWLIDPPFWNWLILCGLFLLLEMFTVTFFFLTWATAAALLALLTLILPNTALTTQLLIFSILSLVAIAVWWKFACHWQRNPNDEAGKLNNRGRALLGRSFILTRPIEQNYGQLHIDDSLWRIYCDEDLPAGSKVTITDIDSLTLKVCRAE